MGLLDNIKQQIGSQFIEIIQWLDDTNDSLVYRFPVYNQEIKMNAQLTVRENQAALFINEGKAADLFAPGRYELTTQNLPILTDLRGWKYGFQSPFKAEVYFFNTRLFTDLKWGTTNPVMMRDAEFGMIRLRAFGTYAMKIADPKIFFEHDRRDAGPDDDGRDHRPAPVDDPLEALRRDRRVEDRGARPRLEVRRAVGARQADPRPRVRRLRPRALEVLHRERLPPRGGRGRDRPADEARRPRRPPRAVHAAPGRRGDQDRRGEPRRHRRRRRRPRRRAGDRRGDGAARSSRWPAQAAPPAARPARRRPAAAPPRRGPGRAPLVAHHRRQDVRPVHRRRAEGDDRRRAGRAVDARVAPGRRRLGAARELRRLRGTPAAAPPPPPPPPAAADPRSGR